MASAPIESLAGRGDASFLLTVVEERGTAAHPYCASDALLNGDKALRNLADVVHGLCSLHGRHPGIIDHAAARVIGIGDGQWFEHAVPAFFKERQFLARLAANVGPVPGTPGARDMETTQVNQHHAIGLLATSERKGCALGAALALAAEWTRIRPILNAAAERCGTQAPPCTLGSRAEIGEVAAAAATSEPIRRAMRFGAEQIATQHFGLWELLETRQHAREHIR